ncbi:MAG: stage III sporulation protein AB [Clostridia bacterium]|nr:stage III sporulation protein AB [Clostridia bacterium]
MIKLITGAVVLAGCAALGMFFASGFRRRVQQLVELENVFAQLEFDIDYLSIPLDESFEKAAKNSCGAISEMFLYITDRLRKNRCCDMQMVWKRAIDRSKDDLFLSDDDKRILTDFSKTLGSGNKEKEKNNIKMTLMRLKLAEDEARTAAECNVKMYRGLGILTGVFIVIVLI